MNENFNFTAIAYTAMSLFYLISSIVIIVKLLKSNKTEDIESEKRLLKMESRISLLEARDKERDDEMKVFEKKLDTSLKLIRKLHFKFLGEEDLDA